MSEKSAKRARRALRAAGIPISRGSQRALRAGRDPAGGHRRQMFLRAVAAMTADDARETLVRTAAAGLPTGDVERFLRARGVFDRVDSRVGQD